MDIKEESILLDGWKHRSRRSIPEDEFSGRANVQHSFVAGKEKDRPDPEGPAGIFIDREKGMHYL